MRNALVAVALLLCAGCAGSRGASTVPFSGNVAQAPAAQARQADAVRPGEPPLSQYHEFQADCKVVRHAKDDPIVFPGKPNASHDHTFFGNLTTNAFTTAESLRPGPTNCVLAADRAAYWTPTLLSHGRVVDPEHIIVYYKSGIEDYTAVRPFPFGLKVIAGDAMTMSAAAFSGGWSCGNNHNLKDLDPALRRTDRAGQRQLANRPRADSGRS